MFSPCVDFATGMGHVDYMILFVYIGIEMESDKLETSVDTAF